MATIRRLETLRNLPLKPEKHRDFDDPQWEGVVVAGGLYMASSLQTRRVRQAISDDSVPFKKLFSDRDFKKSFKSDFEPLAKAHKCPRGFDPDHPDIEWIKLKTFFVCKTLTMKEFSSQDLTKNIVRDFRQLLRLNEILQDAICSVPCDHIPVRSWPLFRARHLLRGVIESFKQEQIH